VSWHITCCVLRTKLMVRFQEDFASSPSSSEMGSIVDPIVDKPFEGAEKLLEISFQRPRRHIAKFRNGSYAANRMKLVENDSEPEINLLRLRRDDVEKILDKVNCSILNECRSDQVTAYLLSESSLFIFEDRMIVKTCGQTNLLNAIEDFIGLGKSVGFDSVAEVFYSRPKFLNPDEQPFRHQKFKRETETLLNYFDKGLARVLGSTNSDCYHLFCFSRNRSPRRSNCTVEVIMNSLDNDKRMLFFKEGDRTASDVTKSAGIADLFTNSSVMIDDYLFEPCGYSVNGIIDQKRYFTVHVTPEKCASYASFETDHCENAAELVGKVVAIFQPSRFIVTVISDESSHADVHGQLRSADLVAGYERCEFQFAMFCHQTATFARFESRRLAGPPPDDGAAFVAAAVLETDASAGDPREPDPRDVWCQGEGPYF
ncbi:hypothetical protein BOX15_Mlig005749g1, partial [Macrostomum lignano]